MATENDITLGKDWRLVGNNGADFVVEHLPSGNTYTLDGSSGGVDVGSLTADSVTTDQGTIGNDWGNNDRWSTRPWRTTEELEIFVDKSSGDNSNDGSQSNPLKDFKAAIERIPHDLRHPVSIYLADGDYSNEARPIIHNTIAGGNVYDSDNNMSNFHLRIVGHHPDNPLYSNTDRTAVTIGSGQSAANRGHGNDEIVAKGLTVQDGWQHYNDVWGWDEVRFTGGQFNYRAAINGYRSNVTVANTLFDDVGTPARVNYSFHLSFYRCNESHDINTNSGGNGVPFRAQQGCIVQLENSDEIVTNAPNAPDTTRDSMVKGNYGASGLPYRRGTTEVFPDFEAPGGGTFGGDKSFPSSQFQAQDVYSHTFTDENGNGKIQMQYNVDSKVARIRDSENGDIWHRFYADEGAMDLTAQDLSALTLGSSDTGKIYRHDGANSISADGGSTSSAGYYVWHNSASEFKSIVQFYSSPAGLQ